MNRRLQIIAVVILCVIFENVLANNEAFPARPIRLIVPFMPGGGTDIAGRLLARLLGDTLGQQVIVDNRAGGGTVLGSALLSKSPADGYTLMMNINALAANHTMYRKLPYNTLSDFTPIVLVATTPNVLVVHPSLPVKDLKSFVALARSRPNDIAYASAGVGVGSHLAAELFKLATGTKMLHVPYKGTAPALTAIITGEVQAMVAAVPGTVHFIRERRIKPLAVTSPERTSLLRDIPTMAEYGIKDAEFETWYGVFGPSSMPRDIIQKLNSAVNKALAVPGVKEQFRQRGLEPTGGTSDEFQLYFGAEIKKMARVIAASGARAD